MRSIILLSVSCLIASAIQAQVIHVPADYPTIQQGIQAANPGDTVLVADGTYYEQINFLGKKLLLVASHFIMDSDTSHISGTIIDGSQAPNPDSASVVYFISGEDTTSVLCGFTIQGGTGTYQYLNIQCGGGIYAENSGASILHNIITNNHLVDPDYPGSVGADCGGICIDCPDGCLCIVEDNTIANNSVTSYNDDCGAGGLGIAIVGGNARVRNNLIKGNTCIQLSDDPDDYLYAGGFQLWSEYYPQSTLLFSGNKVENNVLTGNGAGVAAGAHMHKAIVICTGNEFNENIIDSPNDLGGGGLHFWGLTGESVISGNIFRSNVTQGRGGGIWAEGENDAWLGIESNYFFNNSARLGGAIASGYNTLILQNNVFYKNYAEVSGGAIYLTDNPPNYHKVCIINNSFSNNKASLTTGAGGAIFDNGDNALILNSIFWQDSASVGPEIRGNTPFTEIAYCNIDTNLIFNPSELIIGEGIIHEDPVYLDTLLHISDMLSPCLEAGVAEITCHNQTWEAPGYDIEGIPRPQSGGFEMGAYEVLYYNIPESAVNGQQSTVRVYPNPTYGSSQFAVRSSQEGQVTLKLYDIHGREVATLLDETLPAGEHTVQFDASGLSAGIYFYRLTVIPASAGTGGERQTGKLVKF